MIDILRIPDDIVVTGENCANYSKVRFEVVERKLNIYLSAPHCRPEFICLRWNYTTTEPTRILGDKWERAYGDLTWKSLDGERFMPWYFLANNGVTTVGCGVMVQANSFVSFEYDGRGVCGWFDIRCGGQGVNLGDRELLVASVVCEQYDGISAFEAAVRFCRVMSPNPILPKEPVYGGNNWYYAYGKSSAEEIYSDTRLQVEFSKGNSVRPYMVIDDCWQINSCAGPWRPNEKFKDMKQVASNIDKIGATPGIWVRFLHDIEAEELHPEWCLHRRNMPPYLDPSRPEVIAYIRSIIRQIKSWGFRMIKHDFSTVDVFGSYGNILNGTVTNLKDWTFYDTSRTGAEIILDFYRAIREEAGMDTVIIGCNTISHLCAGLVEINRVGDDTSGREWSRTRTMGINSLAFRLPQNRSFYMVDADCVGIIKEQIDWKLNRQWLELLSVSGTPLFVSCKSDAITSEQKEEIKKAYRFAAVQNETAIPLDWEYNNQPQNWLIGGETKTFNWIEKSYPALLNGTDTQPG